MDSINDKKIHIALDSNVVIELASYILNVVGLDESSRPSDYSIHENLIANNFNSAPLIQSYKGKRTIPFVLKNCGYIAKGKDGVERNLHLESAAKLYEEIKNGRLEVYITKTTLYEVYGTKEQGGWIIPVLKSNNSNGIINVVDDKIITQMSCMLAKLYGIMGAMEKTYDTENDRLVPSRDAYIMAQASMLGLSLLTYNGDDFINRKTRDTMVIGTRSQEIEQINRDCALLFKTNIEGEIAPPKPMFPDYFLKWYYEFMDKKGSVNINVKPIATVPNFDLNSMNRLYKRIERAYQQEYNQRLRIT